MMFILVYSKQGPDLPVLLSWSCSELNQRIGNIEGNQTKT